MPRQQFEEIFFQDSALNTWKISFSYIKGCHVHRGLLNHVTFINETIC